MTDGPIRDDHAELLRRRALTEDTARPDAVARRHAAGGRTARENIDDLVDPGSFIEYGRFAIAAQRFRRELDDLIARTPADGLIAGTARINGALFGDERSTCAVLSYDYTVLAGTQGYLGHRKKDRLFDLIERMRLPTVFFAEGGGGRPGDTDFPSVSSLETRAFKLWAQLSGVVPRVAIVKGRCFAGNAVIAGASDLIVATKDTSIGMGGPAMIAGGGLGDVHPDEVGPISVQEPNGVVDVVVADEAEAVAVTKRLIGYLQGSSPGEAVDQTALRAMIPERERRAYDVGPVITTLADQGSVTFLRPRFAREMVTAFARIEGRAVGVIANDTRYMAGAITAAAADKAARFLQLCDCFGIPVVSLIDCPGYMVGPAAEAEALVRRASRMLVAGAALRVPMVAVVLRRGYGLGAQAMTGGSLHEPVLTVAWPGAHLGPMGLEGAVRLGLRKELEAIADDDERERRVREATASAQDNAKALNAAALFEIDDVIDPADTRRIIAETLTAATAYAEPGPPRRFVDTW
ncbi:biotin carboxylase [Mycobacteriaceae bacterium 1482268.1]|nr:biotin carboxylase [Mycobacteriaceae bacterium 1482268.1]